MEQVKGVVKHIVLAKFKEGVAEEEIEKHIKEYANLCNLIEHMKSFEWGTDVSIENLHQGFTHVFETTFLTLEDRSAYVAHPAHVKFGTAFLHIAEKIVVIDYVPERNNRSTGSACPPNGRPAQPHHHSRGDSTE